MQMEIFDVGHGHCTVLTAPNDKIVDAVFRVVKAIDAPSIDANILPE